jgi:hypothetical protein
MFFIFGLRTKVNRSGVDISKADAQRVPVG